MDLQKYKKILGKNAYIQGFAGNPIFLNLTGYSGFVKEDETGLKFSHFLVKYKNDYGEAAYFIPDLKRIWKKLKPRIFSDANFLKKYKKIYLKDWQKYLDLYKKINKINLEKINDKEIIKLLNQCAWGQIYSAGIGHLVIEPGGIEIEKEFRGDLLKAVKDKSKFNNYFAQLSAPTQYSWVSQEELDLKNISRLPQLKIESELKNHLKKYFFAQNSYKESKKFNLNCARKKLEEMKKEKINIEDPDKIKKRKQKLIRKLKLDRKLQKQIEIIDFISIWQDERKASIFIAIHYLDKVIREISHRTSINRKILYYLSPKESLNIENLKEIKSLEPNLKERKRGCYYLLYGLDQEEIIVGKNYKKLIRLEKDLEKKENQEVKSLHGSIANIGTALGHVVVCKNISHISKVQKGDILVSSMTRPEFMPAIKKAGAIVTDEGGITCHAAIVARELGKPCVIGTKIATKVLKEGMVVEVRANHGIVNIIG